MTLYYWNGDKVQVSSFLRQFLWELCPFWNIEYWKYTVFHTFLLHVLIYWAEILHMTLFYWNNDQVKVSSICVNFLGVMPLLELRILEIQFSALFSYMLEIEFFGTFILHALTYWAEIFHMTLFNVLQIKFECSIKIFCVKIVWNCYFVGLLHHPFGFSLFLVRLGHLFSTFENTLSAKDHWWGFSTQNAHMVHIVN